MISSRDGSLTTLHSWRTDGSRLEVAFRDDSGFAFSGTGKVLELVDGIDIGSGWSDNSEGWRLAVTFKGDGVAEQKFPSDMPGSVVVTISGGAAKLLLTGRDLEFSLERL